MARKKIPKDRLIELHNRFHLLPVRHKERKRLVMEFAEMYGVSSNTIYRSLRELFKPKSLKRSDTGKPRQIDGRKMEMYCQTITAIKIRSMNKKGRHLSTQEAIRILEHGVNTPKGLVQAPNGLLSKSTVNYYLKRWGYNIASLSVEPVAVRFQANHSNECWQFDMSPSDMKKLAQWPDWIDQKNSRPVLMLYSVPFLTVKLRFRIPFPLG